MKLFLLALLTVSFGNRVFANGMSVARKGSSRLLPLHWLCQLFHFLPGCQKPSNSAVLLVGGFNGTNAMKSAEVLLSQENNCQVPDLPVANYLGNLLLTPGDNKILHCGGQMNLAVEGKRCYELNIETQQWTLHSTTQHIRREGMKVSMPDGNYLFGGSTDGVSTNSDYLPRHSNNWEIGPDLPGGFMYYGCVVKISQDEFVVIGGQGSSGTLTRMVKYNTNSRTWSEWGNLVNGRKYHGCTLVENKIIVAGGQDAHVDVGRSTEVISVETGTSRLVGDMVEPRLGFALVTVGEGPSQRVMAMGGRFNSGSTVEIYDINEETWSLATFSMNEARYMPAFLTITDDICG